MTVKISQLPVCLRRCRPRPVALLIALHTGAIADPAGLTAADWETLLPLARRHELLGRLAASLAARGALDRVPPRVRFHLDSALCRAQSRMRRLCWEALNLRLVLPGMPVLVLKGVACVLRDLPSVQGRMSADLDVLVPKDRLAAAEAGLLANGWAHAAHSAYDDAYYRDWMHELPAFDHAHRGTQLDLHHTILPPTARLHPDPARLLAAAEAVPGVPDLYTPCATDLLLHAAVHACHDGAFTQPLRDVLDLHGLIRDLGDDAFWQALPARAQALDLARPLWYALRLVQRECATPVPPAVFAALAAQAPPRVYAGLLPALVHAVLHEHRLAPIAALALYIRSHWLRMPARLLLPHLARKALMRLQARFGRPAPSTNDAGVPPADPPRPPPAP